MLKNRIKTNKYNKTRTPKYHIFGNSVGQPHAQQFCVTIQIVFLIDVGKLFKNQVNTGVEKISKDLKVFHFKSVYKNANRTTMMPNDDTAPTFCGFPH